MKSKLQVFISSTYKDLIKERQAAVEAVLKSGHIPAGMELFTAGDKSQWEVIQKWIRESDIYMLILGGRYGSIDPKTGLSYTEMEYDLAIAEGKPFFAIVIDENELNDRIETLGKDVTENENKTKLETFRQKVLSKISSFFSDYKDIKLAVLETIPRLESDYELKGWVLASNIPDTSNLSNEIIRLIAETDKLKKHIKEQDLLLQKLKNNNPESDFDELRKLLTEIKVDVSSVKNYFANKENVPNNLSLLDLAFSFKDILISGLTNEYGMSDIRKFIFFTLCPRLQTYDLVQNEKVTGAKYRRYVVTKKGLSFFAFIEKNKFKNISKENSPTPQRDTESISEKNKVIKSPIKKENNRG